MTLNEFINQCSAQLTPIGDLANDALGDSNFPSKESEETRLEYLSTMTRLRGTHDVFIEFLDKYNAQKGHKK